MLRLTTLSSFAFAACLGTTVVAGDPVLPAGFTQTPIGDGLVDPCTMAFSPDGRLFVAERIQGRLRVFTPDGDGSWTLQPEPFATFAVPTDGQGNPERHRSSGVRGFAFAPDFETSGEVFVFYMHDQPRHNRVVKITADPADPNIALPEQTVLFEVPFAEIESSGSHNGGAVAFGADGRLYFTTGDGWNGGDNVQSLATYTGKIFRITRDGDVPADNPFVDDASGDFRAIYALGLRNPYSLTRHPVTGDLYVNDVRGGSKSNIHLVEPGANYGHDGYNGIGWFAEPWAIGGASGGSNRVITGGAWYPGDGPFPSDYHGAYFTSLWGGNGTTAGAIRVITDQSFPESTGFASGLGYPDPVETLKPTALAASPAGRLVYLASSYEAGSGTIFEITSDPPTGDLDGDGLIGPGDLAILLASWGPCAGCEADVSGDGTVGPEDLATLLAAWSS